MKTIPLTKGFVTLIDDADYEEVSKFKWCLSGRRYAKRHIPGSGHKGKHEYLHRFLMPGAAEVDHIDGDGFNNQRKNLRAATSQQNHWGHRRKATGTTSKYRGVSWDSSRNKWAANIKAGDKSTYLGRFSSEVEAARAYDKAARKLLGEFASPNFP